MPPDKGVVLTGDRPTGSLHLGHFVGSLRKRVELQNAGHSVYIVIADFQVLNEDSSRSVIISNNIEQIILDYLSVGIDPSKTNIFIQSRVPAITNLTEILAQITPYSWVARNPTVKQEMEAHLKRTGQKHTAKPGEVMTLFTVGFFTYPVSQAADILFCKGEIVPVGKDQEPHINLAADIAKRFNNLYDVQTFPKPEALIDETTPRLPGLNGPGEKMSKSAGNAIYLSDPLDEVWKKLKSAYTDPQKARKGDPGHPEECPIFAYYNAFDPDYKMVPEVQTGCESGERGCLDCKEILFREVLQPILEEIHQKRSEAENSFNVWEIASEGTKAAIRAGELTINEVRGVMGMDYPLV